MHLQEAPDNQLEFFFMLVRPAQEGQGKQLIDLDILAILEVVNERLVVLRSFFQNRH